MARPHSGLESVQDGDQAFLIPSPTPGRDPGKLQRCWGCPWRSDQPAQLRGAGPVLSPKDTSQQCSCRSEAQCTASLGAGVTYPRAGTQSSHLPGGSWDNITPQWVLPHLCKSTFTSFQTLLDGSVRQARWPGQFTDVKTEAQMGHVSSSRSRCKETAESNETLGFSEQGEAGLAVGLWQSPGK